MGAAASIDAAGSDGNDSVTVDKAKSLLQVDATDNVEARAGRAALFEEWWAKLPKNAKGAVSAEDWNRGVRLSCNASNRDCRAIFVCCAPFLLFVATI